MEYYIDVQYYIDVEYYIDVHIIGHGVSDVIFEGGPHHRGLRPLLFFDQWCGFLLRSTRTR